MSTTIVADELHTVPSNSSLPTYSSATGIELADISPSTSSDSSPAPPAYDQTITVVPRDTEPAPSSDGGSEASPSGDAFAPTVHFQIETTGKQWLSLPIGTRPDPIAIYHVEAGSWSAESVPAYVSIRFSRNDGSCHLLRGDDASQTPVCTTLYRFGPGKPPIFRPSQALAPFHAPTPPASSSSSSTEVSLQDEENGHRETDVSAVDLQIVSKSLTSRTQILKTPLGTFQWRYATRKERAAVPGADQLLVCELVQTIALAGGKKTEESKTRIAQFVRGKETRTRGTGRTTAGNGGRLMLDVMRWADSKDGGREAVEVLVVASCVCMLKKEVDRRRMQQMMILAAGASGGA
ncbi:hypothetical protein COL5a_011821 [Colletotrichum fioriniae]|uniref:uncharacterized protein n=1 Tax=Colletotrichum fioriniae TaxID=710243 RepID=UPI002300F8B3|nr:uncharacterized protein COL516b_009461 [Colletotrichum fioriniae]KAJ0298906.1 hypothetical protein COL516b_009461 [Colletotrichum fioriniae]KAJ0315904.1 hypothetical protein COL5a_011821 [Colletotrichum fioriniae]KAJ3943807.1 hypothetical protein N0V96_006740 [Colletotrichum fioriniae]